MGNGVVDGEDKAAIALESVRELVVDTVVSLTAALGAEEVLVREVRLET